MDQIKIGKFIAVLRKEKNLTQRQLADSLSLSDKTVSKWECGKGLPEVSLMLPLCTLLGITLNDLLSGERISEADYYTKAEENMMNLIEENEENRKKMVLSVICGVITIIAGCSLVAMASFIDMPTAARILLLLFALATVAAGIGASCVLDVMAGYFECPHCKELFVPKIGEYVRGYHTITKRKLICPKCGNTGMCKKRLTRQ